MRLQAAARTANPIRASPAVVLAALAALFLISLLVNVGAGSSEKGRPFYLRLSPAEVGRELLRGDLGVAADARNTIVWRLRLPRALACVLVGSILGMVGSAFQALFRNPLADPYIVGVSSGAAVGGALAILWGYAGVMGGLGLMASAFLAGFGSLALVLALARRRGFVEVHTLLLAGVVVGSLLSAILALVLLAAGQDTNQIFRWLLGSTTPMSWNKIAVMAVMLSIGAVALISQAKRLNALAIGEESAQRLGVNTGRLKPTVLVAGTGMVAVTVGSVGIIGFLGLVAPHIARRLVGVDWRWSLASAGIVGAVLMLLADVVAQRAIAGGEAPVGIVTALLGAPFLLVLLRKASG